MIKLQYPKEPVIERFVIISGCSGGGKSTLLAEFQRRGFATVEEPGRRIVREELRGDGAALPWIDPVKFARRAIAMSRADIDAATHGQAWVFFDRGLIDAALALERFGGEPAAASIKGHRFHHRVFLTPPWSEIYANDSERPHSFDAAVAEYEQLLRAYPALGYETIILPRVGVPERVDLVLRTLSAQRDGV